MMPLRFTPLLCLKRCHACDHWNFPQGVVLLPADPVNSVQTLKAKALEENSTLVVLNLHANSLDGEAAAGFAEMLRKNTTLVELNLAANELGSAGGAALVAALEANVNSGVIKLRLTGIKSITLDSRIRLIDWRDKMPHRQLELDGEQQVVMARAASLNDQKVVDLDLHGCHLSDMDVAWLDQLFASNTHLKCLNLKQNHLGQLAAAAIIRGLEVNTALTSLHLEFNAFEYKELSILRKLQRASKRCVVYLSKG
jgi:hypothetical protein